ncbi:MAG TPA: hypothetical protein PKO15_12200 [Fibrobacteria bacterium]|nr:hypothetical protein [Fibrobacteria bacterium]HOX51740.1 hypothetical protein [Fibrobacteria bacterium]
MRSRLPRSLRRSLDRVLTSPSHRTWLRGVVLVVVLVLGGLGWDLQRRIVPGIRERDREIASLRTLEADLAQLRLRAVQGVDSLERRAGDGVFTDWSDLAGWLEIARSLADSAQGDLEWRVQEGGVSDPRFPDLREVRVEWVYTPTDPSFGGALEFVRKIVADRKRILSMESMGMEADEIGVRTVRFRVKAWIVGRRG